jgi:hypothetical protein
MLLTSTEPITLDVPLPSPAGSTPEVPIPTALAIEVPDVTAAETPEVPPSEPITVLVPEIEMPTNTPVPPTDTPQPTATPTDTTTPRPTDMPTVTGTPTDTPTPTLTPTPTETPVPIDIGEVVYTSLPPVFVGASILLFIVILAAGLSVVRGPRDI